jgi:hypothetical protein
LAGRQGFWRPSGRALRVDTKALSTGTRKSTILLLDGDVIAPPEKTDGTPDGKILAASGESLGWAVLRKEGVPREAEGIGAPCVLHGRRSP